MLIFSVPYQWDCALHLDEKVAIYFSRRKRLWSCGYVYVNFGVFMWDCPRDVDLRGFSHHSHSPILFSASVPTRLFTHFSCAHRCMTECDPFSNSTQKNQSVRETHLE